MASFLRMAAAALFVLGGFALIAESSRLGLLRCRPLFLLVAVPLALLCLWSWRRKPEDRP